MKQVLKRGDKYTATVRLSGYSLTQTFPLKSQAHTWANRVDLAIRDSIANGVSFNREDWLPKKKVKTRTPKELEREQEEINSRPCVEWTLSRAIREYKDTELDKLKGWKQALLRLNTWSRSEFSDVKLNEITPDMLAQWVRKRSLKVSASTIRNDIFRISAIYEMAIKPTTKHGWGLTDMKNPVKEIALPRVTGSRKRRLRKHEEEHLLYEISQTRNADELLPLLILSIETGMRKGELLKTTLGEVNITKRGTEIRKWDTKNHDSRTVFLSKRAEEAIKPLLDTLKGKPDNTLLFRKLTSDSVEYYFAKCREKAGCEDLRLHDLRHEAISRLADKGLSLGALANQSGHRTANVLMKYINASETDIRRKLEQNYEGD